MQNIDRPTETGGSTSCAPSYAPSFALRQPVEIVTTKGRSIFNDSFKLLSELQLSRYPGAPRRAILQVREGPSRATPASVAALEIYLQHFGLSQLTKRLGPGVWCSRYGWALLVELVGMEWTNRLEVVAPLPPADYFRTGRAAPAKLVAGWDGTWSSLEAMEGTS